MADKPKLSEAIKMLDDALLGVVFHFNEIALSDVPLLVTSYKQLKDNVDKLKDTMKIATELQQKVSYQLIPTAFEGLGMDSVTVRGYSYNVAVRLNASIPEDQREKGHQWLKDNDYSAIIIPNVNVKTLSSAMGSYIEEKGLEPPADAIKIHRQPYTSVRKK